MRLVWGTVARVTGETPDFQRLEIRLDDAGAAGTVEVAVSYPRLLGACEVGERALVNVTAVDLGLGTGGSHVVVARAGEGVALDAPSGGHIMKLRYTPLQTDVLVCEDPDSPHHSAMAAAEDLGGMPVVCCGLHSQAPIVAAAIKAESPEARVAYVMTDEAALPFALSDVMRTSVAEGLVDATVSCGHAFGAQIEAVNTHSGLLAARHVCGANVAIAGVGPGIVGTSTPFGHGGVAQGETINAVGALGGIPVACLRVSFADERERHRGVSHHSLAALGRVALARATVAVPILAADRMAVVDGALASAGIWERHERVDMAAAEAGADTRGVVVRTMGRSLAEDPAFFAAAEAAGRVAGRLARGD